MEASACNSIRGCGDVLARHLAMQKSVTRLPYIIVYILGDEGRIVFILRVIHTAREWRDGDWPI